MKVQRALTATSAVAILAGLFASTASAQGTRVDLSGASLRLAMHDDMMKMPGMKGGGMGGPATPAPPAHPPGASGATPHAPATKGPGAHGSAGPPPSALAPASQQPHGPAYGPAHTMIDLPTDRIEGRIAFLQAELRVTDAQMPAWHELADVIRANAKRMIEAETHRSPAIGALDRLNEHERWLTARLDSVRALKTAYAKLHAVLDESQRKTGDQLVAHQMGIR